MSGKWKWVSLSSTTQVLLPDSPRGPAVMSTRAVGRKKKGEILRCHDHGWPTEADKALIAAAPELFDALKKAFDVMCRLCLGANPEVECERCRRGKHIRALIERVDSWKATKKRSTKGQYCPGDVRDADDNWIFEG